MTAKELARRLNGRRCGEEVLMMELVEIVRSGLVVAYASSDDLLVLCGAIDYRADAYEGRKVRLKNGRPLPPCDCEWPDECPAWAEYTAGAKIVAAVWARKDEPTEVFWRVKTDIPHETFYTYDNDGIPHCRGIVFHAKDTWDKPALLEVAAQWATY